MSNDAFQAFLEETKKKFDKYFDALGYVCFMFNKETHKGQSVFISNAPESVLKIVQPYANAKEVAEAKAKKSEQRRLRRIK